jgi:rRNA maturation RNase YbeY
MISLNLVEVRKPTFLRMNVLKKQLKELIRIENKSVGDIAIVLTSDAYLLQVNQSFLKHDFFTDIITFDYCEDNVVNGDLLISIERVLENSVKLNTSFENEFLRVVYHGVLHLCGYKDKKPTEISQMREKESFYLDLFVSRETNSH